MTTTLYRAYDEAGGLLYVGVTSTLLTRFAAHAHDKPWWTQVASIDLEHFEDRAQAMAAEAAAIDDAAPTRNRKRGDGRRPAPRNARRRPEHSDHSASPLRALRIAHDPPFATVEALANVAGLHPNTVRLIEYGTNKPNDSTLVKLAKALGVDAGELDGKLFGHRAAVRAQEVAA